MVCAIWINLSVVSCCCNSFGARDVYLSWRFPRYATVSRVSRPQFKVVNSWIDTASLGSWISWSSKTLPESWHNEPPQLSEVKNRFLGTERSHFFPMPKRYYDDYSDMYLKNNSQTARKQHMSGRRHINNKVEYWQRLIREKGLTPPIYPPPPGMVLPMPKLAASNPAPTVTPGLAKFGMPGMALPLPGLAALPGLMPGLKVGVPGAQWPVGQNWESMTWAACHPSLCQDVINSIYWVTFDILFSPKAIWINFENWQTRILQRDIIQYTPFSIVFRKFYSPCEHGWGWWVASGSYPWIWHVQGPAHASGKISSSVCNWDFHFCSPMALVPRWCLNQILTPFTWFRCDDPSVLCDLRPQREQENDSNADVTSMFDCRGVESHQMLRNQAELPNKKVLRNKSCHTLSQCPEVLER